jgi:hypothetical protein
MFLPLAVLLYCTLGRITEALKIHKNVNPIQGHCILQPGGIITKQYLKSYDDDDRPLLEYKEDIQKVAAIKSLDELAPPRKVESFSSSSATSRAKETAEKQKEKKKVGTKTFGSLTAEDLNADTYVSPSGKVFRRGVTPKKEDLNGIQPYTPFIFSFFAAVMSFVAWQASTYLAGHFAIQFVDSELYPVQRVAIVGRNVVVGIFTLFTGFSGVVSLGLVLLGVAVSIGVAKGELDPTAVRPDGDAQKSGEVKDLRVDKI